MNCLRCGKPIEKDRRRTMHKECREEWRTETIEKERNGLSRPSLTWGETIGAAMRRDNYICQVCGKDTGYEIAPGVKIPGSLTEVHHRIPFSMGGSNSLDNLITLCHNCHMKAHPEGYRKTARRMRENQSLC